MYGYSGYEGHGHGGCCSNRVNSTWPRFAGYPYSSPYSDYGYLNPGGSGWYYYPSFGTFTSAAMKQRQGSCCGGGRWRSGW